MRKLTLSFLNRSDSNWAVQVLTQDGLWLEILDLESRGFILSM